MKKEDFLNSVLEQVSCKSVRAALRSELEAHIDDQAEAFKAAGLPPEQCEEEAVKTMGDSVDIGMRLDIAHRRHFPLAAVIAAAVIMLCGMLLRYSLSQSFPRIDFNSHDLKAAAVGLLTFILFSCMDYTIFARLTKKAYPIAVAALSALIIAMYYAFIIDDGQYIPSLSNRNRGLTVFYGCIMLLPFMCGFVQLMRGKRLGGFLLCCAVLTVPAAVPCWYAPSFAALMMNSFNALMIMTYAVKKDYFNINKRTAYLIMYIPATLLSAAVIVLRFLRNRMVYGDWYDVHKFVNELLSNSGFLGRGRGGENAYFIDDSLQLAGVMHHYGIAAGIVFGVILILLPIIMYKLSRRVHSSFGRLTVSAIIFVFAVQTVWFIGTNIGLFSVFATYAAAPFLTGSVTAYAAWGMLLGVFASAYIRADILPEQKLDRRKKSA